MKPFLGTGVRPMVKPLQPGQLTPGFTYTAYEYLWENGTLPPFTTPVYAVLPVQVEFTHGNETWTAETTLFEADFACERAAATSVSYTEKRGVSLKFISRDGRYTVQLCDERLNEDSASIPVGVPYWDDGEYLCDGFTAFPTPWTSISQMVTSETYLYAWASGEKTIRNYTTSASPPPRNITAIFCTASYYSQSVLATLTMPSGGITHVNRTGSRTPFHGASNFAESLNGTFFNDTSTLDQYQDSQGKLVGLGYRPPHPPNQDLQLNRLLCPKSDGVLSWNGTILVRPGYSFSCIYMSNIYTLPPFALSKKTPESLGALLNPEVLASTYESTFKLLFALAVAKELVDIGATDAVEVTRNVYTRGFTVDVLWARSAQCGLVTVAAMVAILCAINWRRTCELIGEPNSLAAALQLLAASFELCTELRNSEFNSPEEVCRVLAAGGKRYELLQGQHGPMIQVLDRTEHTPVVQAVRLGPETAGFMSPDDGGPEPSVQQTLWMLRTGSGAAIVVFLGLVVLLLIAAFAFARVQQGMSKCPIRCFITC